MDSVRLWAMARKEWIQLRRDPRSMILAFVLPLFLLLFFGYAITWDINDIRISVVDQDNTASEPPARGGLRLQRVLHRGRTALPPGAAAEEDLVQGRVRGVLDIPPRYQRDLHAGRGAEVQLLLDGSDANTATIAQNYADAIVRRGTAWERSSGPYAERPVPPGDAHLVQPRTSRAGT